MAQDQNLISGHTRRRRVEETRRLLFLNLDVHTARTNSHPACSRSAPRASPIRSVLRVAFPTLSTTTPPPHPMPCTLSNALTRPQNAHSLYSTRVGARVSPPPRASRNDSSAASNHITTVCPMTYAEDIQHPHSPGTDADLSGKASRHTTSRHARQRKVLVDRPPPPPAPSLFRVHWSGCRRSAVLALSPRPVMADPALCCNSRVPSSPRRHACGKACLPTPRKAKAIYA